MLLVIDKEGNTLIKSNLMLDIHCIFRVLLDSQISFWGQSPLMSLSVQKYHLYITLYIIYIRQFIETYKV